MSAQTFIYFIRAGEFVKIGQSRRWKERMANMQVGSAYTIVPLLVLIGEPELEGKLHNRFRADHFRGEWFHMGPGIVAFIKANLKDCVAKESITEIPKAPNPWDRVLEKPNELDRWLAKHANAGCDL
jgi:hypothetical protein